MPIPTSTIQHSYPDTMTSQKDKLPPKLPSNSASTVVSAELDTSLSSNRPHVTKIEIHTTDNVCSLKPPKQTHPASHDVSPPTKKPSFIDVFRKILNITDGRDKLMKLIQYVLKIVMITYFRQPGRHPALRKRLSALSSSFSNTRKILRLGNCVEPYNKLNTEYGKLNQLKGYSSVQLYLYIRVVFKTAVSLVNTLSDDLFCLSKLGVLSPEVGRRTGRLSLRLWMINIVLDSQDSIQESFKLLNTLKMDTGKRDEVKTLDQLFWSCLNVVKLLCDGIFCSYDIFECKFSPLFHASVSLISGVLSTYKLWFRTIAA
ncbi:hypothetical protein K7432_001490 [Basidiobolus ranarum]|uniref:Uncharacterized protein n=1 Tax=Basidiobolus ranarum TaxID=34480 RepID=A0ABR2X303_9FUNG